MKKHIVLVGFMGSGKSTVGRLLAEELHCRFEDMDEFIERKSGTTISSIFETEGEDAFRNMEREALIELLSYDERIVISTGGGTPCVQYNLQQILIRSHSFFLKVGINRLTKRLKNDNTRPLLSHLRNEQKRREFIYSKLKVRKSYYEQADHVIMACYEPERIIKTILKKIKS